ncbi:MAG: chemotaxis protein CheB, partial [Candidatus Entotheonellia bacterium]
MPPDEPPEPQGTGLPPEAAQTPVGERPGHSSFPIVGIGTLAGGLEAFTQLLTHLPEETGMAFVLVQHLDPKHESKLTDLLARATRLPVQEATQG